jgi:hypothetical protein
MSTLHNIFSLLKTRSHSTHHSHPRLNLLNLEVVSETYTLKFEVDMFERSFQF